MSRHVSKALRAKVLKKYGDGALASLSSQQFSKVDAVLPTGSVVLDRWVIGVGGYPYGHITEMWGKEASGKTSLLLAAIARCQAEDGLVLLRDAEQKIQPDWAAKLGVAWDDVELQPEGTVEDFCDLAETLMEGVKKCPFLVALDSLAFLESREEAGKDGEAAMGANARAWAAKIKGFVDALAKRQAAFVFCNQPRSKITSFGAFTITPGGSAMKAAPLLRLKVEAKGHFKDPNRGDGALIQVTANKNQMAPPWRKCELRLNYLGYFDEAWNIVNHAKDVGCLDKKQDRRHWKDALKNLGWEDAIPVVEAQIARNEAVHE